MPLLLTDEQTMLRDNARSFLSKNAPVAHLRHLRDSHDEAGFSRPLWKEFASLGWSGVLVPQEHGGLALGHVEAGVVMEEIGRTLTPSPFLSTALIVATILARTGSPRQQKEYLARIAAAEIVATLAVDETAKHRPEQIALVASRDGGGFRLDGVKTFVIDAHVADLLVVAARTAGKAGERAGITLFAVDPTAAGVTVERTSMVDSHGAARVTLSSVRAAPESVLGEADAGWSTLEGALNVARAAVAAEMVGISEEVFARTLAYLKERRQFGKAIGEFQALQHRAADLYCEMEVTRAAVLKALQALDSAFDSSGPVVAMAKARAGTSTTLAVQEGVQMHGGIGMTDEFDVGLFMKRARVCQELFGDTNFHADRLARLANY